MSMDHQEELNEYKINAYDFFLKAMTKPELLEHFKEMAENELVECIKYTYGNDGKDDLTFES